MLTKVLGSSPKLRVIEFLIKNKESSYNLVELRKFANTGYSTLKEIMPELEKEDVVYVDRIIGKSKLYKINKDNLLIQAFIHSMKFKSKKRKRN